MTAALTAAVQGLAGTVFPWADRIPVHESWFYEWWSKPSDVVLPATEKNTALGKGDANDQPS